MQEKKRKKIVIVKLLENGRLRRRLGYSSETLLPSGRHPRRRGWFALHVIAVVGDDGSRGKTLHVVAAVVSIGRTVLTG